MTMINNKLPLLPCIEINPQSPAVGAVIWLHGLGADGNDFAPIVPELKRANQTPLRFIFPHAPSIPVTINNGYVMPAWYDITSMSINQRVDLAGVHASVKQLENLIQRENDRGIPTDKIVLAGFSQGAVIALTTGLHSSKRLAGIMALSGYLPSTEKLAAAAKSANQPTPIFIGHGTGDAVVPVMLGKFSYDALSKLGYNVSWHQYAMQHSVCAEEINDIDQWLEKIFKHE